jgi:predicted AAA+ superfamily ATPase
MILKETLKNIVKTQRQNLALYDCGVPREALESIDMNTPFAVVLSGIRRCGKSTLLHQLMKKTGQVCYFNFEDPRALGFEVGDFQRLNDALMEEYGDFAHYFLDEIQNAPKWEVFVRSMLDQKKKFVITGSNASLLSKELGTRLTGRHIRQELFPFSYAEMLALDNKQPGPETFGAYLERGGFPEYLKLSKDEILHELLNDILARDIVVRHKLRSARVVSEMAVYFLTNVGKEFTYNNLKKTFGLGSVNTAINIVSYFEDSYLLFAVPRFDYSFKKQRVNPKKIYAIDNGFARANSASFSSDRGRMLENTVFLYLRRKYRDIYYFKGKDNVGECDFIVKEKGRITAAVQSCYKLTEENKDREIGGLLAALEEFKLKEGVIVTNSDEDLFEIRGKKITVMSAWKWMVGL